MAYLTRQKGAELGGPTAIDGLPAHHDACHSEPIDLDATNIHGSDPQGRSYVWVPDGWLGEWSVQACERCQKPLGGA